MKRTFPLWLAALLIAAIGFLFVPGAYRALAADKDTGKKADATFEVYKDKGGDYRWRLRTQNTQVIASSGQSFSSKQSCMSSIESVKKHAAKADVKEVTEAATAPANE